MYDAVALILADIEVPLEYWMAELLVLCNLRNSRVVRFA